MTALTLKNIPDRVLARLRALRPAIPPLKTEEIQDAKNKGRL
jgi:hypothetical protein